MPSCTAFTGWWPIAERQPLLLSVDDVQWADGPSLRFLLYLVRRLEGLPAAIAIALRTGEPAEKPELLRALLLEIRSPVLRPAPLSDTAIQSMVGWREVSFGKPGLGGGGVLRRVEGAVGAAVV